MGSRSLPAAGPGRGGGALQGALKMRRIPSVKKLGDRKNERVIDVPENIFGLVNPQRRCPPNSHFQGPVNAPDQ